MEEYPIANLHDLLDYDARKFINAEIQLRNALPGWIATANSIKLKNVLQKYMDYIRNHKKILEAFFEEEKISSSPGSTCRVMHAFIEDTFERLSSCADPEVKDACLLASIQLINHYKISAFGTAAAFANALGMERQASIFREAEINEKQIDDRLSQLAEHEINSRARTPIVLTR